MSDKPVEDCDNPEWDCTDFAHPAWWRGHDYTMDIVIKKITEILDGEDEVEGDYSNANDWHKLRSRVRDLVKENAKFKDDAFLGLMYSELK